MIIGPISKYWLVLLVLADPSSRHHIRVLYQLRLWPASLALAHPSPGLSSKELPVSFRGTTSPATAGLGVSCKRCQNAGYQTSSLYCDTRLSKFQAECLGLDSPFLVKTHYPLSEDVDPELPHWKRFNRAVRVIRNPFDSIWSTYHFSLTGK